MDNNTPMGGNYPCDGLNSAPLYQQAFRWFKEKYDLGSGFILSEYVLHKTKNGKSYQEAQEACLRKLIEIVNQNKDG
jgi:hypothetical protein